ARSPTTGRPVPAGRGPPDPRPEGQSASAGERLGADHRDLDRLPGWGFVADRVPFVGAGECLAERGRRRVDLDPGRLRLLAGADQECLGVRIVLEPDGDHHSRTGHTSANRSLADLRVPQQLLQLPDPALLLALLLARCLIAAVFPQVAFLPAVVDLLGNDR